MKIYQILLLTAIFLSSFCKAMNTGTGKQPKFATATPTKAQKLLQEKKELEQQNSKLTDETLDLRADKASILTDQDNFKKVGKKLASMSFSKEDECSLFIKTAGEVIQSITLHEGSKIGFNKNPIYTLFEHQQINASNCAQKNIPSTRSFIKQSFAPFITGMIVATGGCAAYYFIYLNKK